jgi:hypothetical protein
MHLRNINCKQVLISHDVDSKFNTFLNILRIFQASFLTKIENWVFENNGWITKWLKTSTEHK